MSDISVTAWVYKKRVPILIAILSVSLALLIVYSKKIATLLLLLVLFLFLRPAFKEIARIPSPDGKVDVVLIKVCGGGASSTKDWVYIVPAGARWNFYFTKKPENIVLIFDYVEDLQIRWSDNENLTLQYKQAKIEELRNDFSCGGRHIKIIAKET